MIDFFSNSALFSMVWPLAILFALYLKKKREQGRDEERIKTKNEMERDRKLFSSIGGGDGESNGGWPLGYMGFDPRSATDEVIQRFIEQDQDKDKKQEEQKKAR